ncbi:MAG: hypothetical protein OFPI_27240 [Osedax symbiont Rs2]|nr:MAG: hypothetical protein OFPI_27240 [Osedax symbiont Rs2]
MMAGFFLKTPASLFKATKKDFQRLLIPYLFFSILAIAVESIKRWGLNREGLDYFNELIAVIFWMDYNHLKNSYAFVLWFLPALFVAKFLYNLTVLTLNKKYLQFLVFVLCFITSFVFDTPFALSLGLNSVLWLCIGSAIFKFIQSDRKNNAPRIKLLVSLIFIMVIVSFYKGIPTLDVANLIYDDILINIIWSVSFVVVMSLIFVSISIWIGLPHLVSSWGKNTMFLFVVHPYTNNLSHVMVEKIGLGWSLKLFLSLVFLFIFLQIKERFFVFKNV